MEPEILTFLLGTAVAVIAVLVSAIGITLKRYGQPRDIPEHNPNFTTMDNKLNTIVIILTRIETRMGNTPSV